MHGTARLGSTARMERAPIHHARAQLIALAEHHHCPFGQRYPADRATTEHLARLPSDLPSASYEVCQLLPLEPFPDFPHPLARLPSDLLSASYEVCSPLPLKPFPQS